MSDQSIRAKELGRPHIGRHVSGHSALGEPFEGELFHIGEAHGQPFIGVEPFDRGPAVRVYIILASYDLVTLHPDTRETEETDHG